jgi:hypothetical protein
MTKLKSFKLFFALLCTSFLMVSQLCADPPSDKGQKGKDKGSGKAGNGDVGYALDLSLLVSAGISVGDARRLAVNEGLTGMKPMPPGIAKTRMPGAYVNQLPRHEGYEWLQVGSDLVLVVTGSLVISDVLEGVFR